MCVRIIFQLYKDSFKQLTFVSICKIPDFLDCSAIKAYKTPKMTQKLELTRFLFNLKCYMCVRIIFQLYKDSFKQLTSVSICKISDFLDFSAIKAYKTPKMTQKLE